MTLVKAWRCVNCGHVAPATEELIELTYTAYGNRTSRTSCPNCGSYTLQRAWDDSFTAGEFLVVKAINRIGKRGTK